MPADVRLRDVRQEDLPIFFAQQADPVANHMAAFTAYDPADQDAFASKWKRLLADPTIVKRAIVSDGRVAGNMLCYTEFGKPYVCYWLGREFWGQGIASRALAAFLAELEARPLHAQVAKDNVASLRVLQQCGFAICGEARGFANARSEEIDELVLELKAES